MHKLNESFCFAKISPSSWNSIFGLWHVWNCSLCPFDFFSWSRIFFLKGNVRSELNQRSQINKTTFGKILKDCHYQNPLPSLPIAQFHKIVCSENCFALWSLSESNQRVKSPESFLNRKSKHKKGSNAKLNFDGCPLLYWGCFLHNAISRIVLAWEIQPYLSITSNLPCARRQVR